jgi:hypothetical protein
VKVDFFFQKDKKCNTLFRDLSVCLVGHKNRAKNNINEHKSTA